MNGITNLFACLVIAYLFASACAQQASSYPEEAVVNSNCDTTIHFDIYDQSAEGGQAIAYYTSGNIDSAQITLYGESGRADFLYTFTADSLSIKEKVYMYSQPLSQVKFEDIRLSQQETFKITRDTSTYQMNSQERGVNLATLLQSVATFKLAGCSD